MPVPSEFEEKEFECKLNFEFTNRPGRLWSPGQVLEEHMAGDVAVYAQHNFFEMTGRPWRSGVWFDDGLVWHYLSGRRQGNDAGAPPPDFRANSLVQVKRCHRYVQAQPPLNQPCWKMELYERQQKRLESIASQLGGRLDVGYAAPVFDRRIELFQYARDGELMANSTFPAAIELVGHSRWKYDSPGATGVPNPNDEAITLTSLNERIDELWQEGELDEGPAEQLYHLWNGVREALSLNGERRLRTDIEDLASDAVQSLDENMPDWIRRQIENENVSDIIISWTKAAVAFRMIGGVWTCVGRALQEGETDSE